MLQSLYDHKLGRASLAGPDSRQVPDAGPVPEGSLGWVSDRVHCDGDDLQRLVRGVLHGVALATNLDHAAELRHRHPHTAFATQHGEFIDAAGIITGGRAGEGATSALQRRDEIAGLGGRRASLQQELARREEARAVILASRDTRKDALEAARASLRQKQNEVAGLRAAQGLIEKEIQDAESRAAALARDQERAAQELQEAARRSEELSGRVAECRRKAEDASAR
jgi:chromosome segregation ATPase